MSEKHVLLVMGTRPDAIKLAPVYHQLASEKGLTPHVCVTAQHREMLDQVLRFFDIQPEYDLDIMRPGQDLFHITTSVLDGIRGVLSDRRFHYMAVQGDTSTTFVSALAGFYAGIPVCHVEAGLRTYDLAKPYPEEANRQLVSRLTDLHCAPTNQARDNLLREGVPPERIVVCGNTVIDALFEARRRIEASPDVETRFLQANGFLPDPDKLLILATVHRRENHARMEAICDGLKELAARNPGAELALPVHPNPAVHDTVHKRLGSAPGIRLLPPQDYEFFIYLMLRSQVIVTDSGGIQEEGPTLGKPVVVLRETTERPEALETGNCILVGAEPDRLVQEAERLIRDKEYRDAHSHPSRVFGDGKAAERITASLAETLLARTI